MTRRKTDEEIAAARAHRSVSKVADHARRRAKVLAVVAASPTGMAPTTGLAPAVVLLALAKRGLVERRYVLTPAGRREMVRLNVTADKRPTLRALRDQSDDHPAPGEAA